MLALGADPNKADEWGNYPLHAALSMPETVISRQMNIIEVLLAYGADATLRRNVQSRGSSGGNNANTEEVSTSIAKNQQRFKKDLQKLGVNDTPMNICKNPALIKMMNSIKYKKVTSKMVLEWLVAQATMQYYFQIIQESEFDLGK